MTIVQPELRSRGAVRALAGLWLVVALAVVVLSPASAWATTPDTQATNPPSSSAPTGSTTPSTGAGGRTPVPTWMFVAGGALILVAAGWMVQANRSRA